jgi:hypothetical protein
MAIKTTLDCIPYDAAAIIESSTPDSACLDLLFVNTGTDTVYINGVPLTTNQSLSWSCNEGETLNVKVNITYQTAVAPKCYMIRRRVIK